MHVEIWILFAAVGLMVAGAVIWGKTIEVRREAQFKEAAATLKFNYFGKGMGGLPPGTEGLTQFAQGSLQHVEHLMRGEANGIELTVLDLASSAGLGMYQSFSVRSIAIFRSSQLHLTPFFTVPAGSGPVSLDPPGMERVTIEGDADFRRRQILSGTRPDEVQALFQPAVREFLVENGPFNVEGSGNLLVVYLSRIPLREMPRFLETVFPVYSVFRQAMELEADPARRPGNEVAS